MRAGMVGIVGIAGIVRIGVAAPVQAPPVVPKHLSRFDRTKAEWLMRERLPCLGCHRLEGRGGMIGPDLTGVGERRNAEFIFRTVTDPQATLAGSRMPRVPMPPEWARLVTSYLVQAGGAARPADPGASVDSVRLGAIADGGQLYQRICAACHGQEGKGDGYNAANLPVRPTAHADSARLASRPDDTLFDGIFSGGYILNQSNLMPGWGRTLSPEQIWSLVRYIRQLCRCRGPSWATARDGE